MAFNPINFANIAPQGSPAVRDIFGQLMQGFTQAQIPAQLQRQRESEELANQFRKMQLEQAPQQFAADMEGRNLSNQMARMNLQNAPERMAMERALNEARINKTNMMPPNMGPLEKALFGAKRIEETYGKDSPEAQLAQQYIQRLAQGTGTTLSVDPTTGAVMFSQGSSGRNGPVMQVVDGKIVQRPTTPTTTSQQKGSLANVVREVMAKHIDMPYMGTGANKRLIEDRFLYETTTNPVKKAEIAERLVKAAVAAKLAPEYGGAQLAAQGIQSSVHALEKQEKAITQGWAEGIQALVNNLPPELQELAKERHDNAIADISRARAKYVAEGLPLNLAAKKKQSEKNKFIATRQLDGKTYYKNSKGEWFEE